MNFPAVLLRLFQLPNTIAGLKRYCRKPTLLGYLLLSAMVLVFTGCGFGGIHSTPPDGPPSVKLDPSKIKNAEPRVESRSKRGNHSPYTVFGKQYRVMDSAAGYRERGEASWYGSKFHGRLTSSGEPYDMYQMTAAHKHLPIPSYVSVRNLENNKQIIVRVNDRGPFHGGRVIDLSYAAATKIGMLKNGVAPVEVKVIDPVAWQKSRGKPASKVASRKPRKAEAHASTALMSDERMYLQVGAYSDLGAAQSIQNRLLETLNYNVVIHPTTNNVPIYRVRIGPVPSHAALNELKGQSALLAFNDMVRVVEQ